MKRPAILACIVFGGFLIALAAQVPATANTVDAYFGPYEVHFVSSADCGFPIRWDISGEFHEVDQYSASGTPIRFTATQGHGAVSITATHNGVTFGGTVPQNYVYIANYDSDGSLRTQDFIGNFAHITVPGSGNVLVQTGRIVLDGDGNVLFQAGPNQDFGGDHAEFCAAFG